jgi:hypothetical protein
MATGNRFVTGNAIDRVFAREIRIRVGARQ